MGLMFFIIINMLSIRYIKSDLLFQQSDPDTAVNRALSLDYLHCQRVFHLMLNLVGPENRSLLILLHIFG